LDITIGDKGVQWRVDKEQGGITHRAKENIFSVIVHGRPFRLDYRSELFAILADN